MAEHCYAECRYTECQKKPLMLSVIMLNVAMLSVIMLNVAMLSVIMLNVAMLSVVAPLEQGHFVNMTIPQKPDK